MIRLTIGCMLLFVVPTGASAQVKSRPIDASELREAAAKAIKPIQKSQGMWYEHQTCTSCHHHILPETTLSFARDRGVAFDAAAAREFSTKTFAYLKDLDALVQGHDYIDEVDDASRLVAAHAAGIQPSLSTGVSARFLASLQRADGSWYTMDSRPPQSHSRFTTTANCVRAVSLYMPVEFIDESAAVLRRARDWFHKAEPRTTEDRTFQLLGLLWSGADEPSRQKAARALLAEQRDDGGWAQLPRLASDAYATGEVLYALHQAAGLATDDPAYLRGLQYLLKSQKPDGSWRVATRIHPLGKGSPPNDFEAGFPNGRHNQFISIMGTSWAATALMQALPEKPGEKPKRMRDGMRDLLLEEKDEWIRVALNGSAADLKKALDRGMNANAKTAKGTTALMLAARDPAKVKLLIDRGADVNARADSGFTALIIAARYRGNAESIRLLLKYGAGVNVPKGVRVKNNASALFFAATTGDIEATRALIDAGGKIEEIMMVLGQIPTTPLLSATLRGDAAMAEYLIRSGADPKWKDKDNNMLLDGAVGNNHVEMVKLLLTKGVKANYVDIAGMTPLLYAVSLDFGDTAVLEALLAAGADWTAKDNDGRTAIELAKLYKHAAMEEMLKKKSSRGTEMGYPEVRTTSTESVTACSGARARRPILRFRSGLLGERRWPR